MLRFKVDVMGLFKQKGISANKLRSEKVFGSATLQKMRHKQIVSMNEFERVCDLLNAQPGDLIEYVRQPEDENQ